MRSHPLRRVVLSVSLLLPIAACGARSHDPDGTLDADSPDASVPDDERAALLGWLVCGAKND